MSHPLTLIVWTALLLLWVVIVAAIGVGVAFLWNWWQARRAFDAQCRGSYTDYESE